MSADGFNCCQQIYTSAFWPGTLCAALCLWPCGACNHTCNSDLAVSHTCTVIIVHAPCLRRGTSDSTTTARPLFCVAPAAHELVNCAMQLTFPHSEQQRGGSHGKSRTAEGKWKFDEWKENGDKQQPMQFQSVSGSFVRQTFFFSLLARLGADIWMKDKSQATLDEFHSNAAQIFLACRRDI